MAMKPGTKLGPRIKIAASETTLKRAAFGRMTKRKVELALRQTVNFKEPDKQVAGFVNDRRLATANVARTFYVGMLRTVKGILNQTDRFYYLKAVADPKKSAALNTSFVLDFPPSQTAENLKRVRVPLQSGRQYATSWKGLEPSYVAVYQKGAKAGKLREPYGRWKGLPKSANFWKKTGRSARAYSALMAGMEKRLTSKAFSTEKSVRILKPSGRRELYKVRYDLDYPKLGSAALNRILRESFTSGRALKYSVNREYVGKNWGPLGGPSGTERIAYPEASRPMLARFAAAVGKAHQAALAQALKD